MFNAVHCETSQKLAKMLCGGIGLPKNVTKMIFTSDLQFLEAWKIASDNAVL